MHIFLVFMACLMGGGNLKKLITFEIQAVSLGVLVVILSLFMGADLSKREFFSIVTPLTSQICWYYSAYILLMVVAPFLNEGIAKLTRKEYTLALCVMIVICYGGNFYYHRVSTSFMLLLFVYLIGRYNRRFPIQYLDRHASLILFVSLSLNFILSVVGSYLIGEKSVKYLENNHNPLLIISAMSLFSLALKKKNCGRLVRFLSNLAPFSLGVYLLHAEFLSLDSYKFRTECYNPYMVTLFYTLLVYLICVSIVYVRNKVMRRIECRITEEIEFITNRLVVE